MSDRIVAEVRAARDRHSAQFGYDLKAIFRSIHAQQDASGRKYVRYPARRIIKVEGTGSQSSTPARAAEVHTIAGCYLV